MRKTVLLLLVAPLLVLLVAIDVIKLPFLLIIFPIWLLMDAIFALRGVTGNFPGIYIAAATACTYMGMEIAGINPPKWMD